MWRLVVVVYKQKTSYEMRISDWISDVCSSDLGRIKTLPGSQWAAGRAYNEIIKKVFDERGIEIPYPHRTIYWGEDKHGEVSPLRIMKERAEEEGEAPALKPSATD